MSEEKNSKNCRPKNKGMFAYGIIQISATIISALSLLSIAIGLCSIKTESKTIQRCVKERTKLGETLMLSDFVMADNKYIYSFS